MTDPDPFDPIWFRISLAAVAQQIEKYELWKSACWYGAVDWLRVITALDDALQHVCHAGFADRDRLLDQLQPAEETFDELCREGLVSLVNWPIQAFPAQLVDGGHRLAAMRLQRIAMVPGMCCPADVGQSVELGQLYPTSR